MHANSIWQNKTVSEILFVLLDLSQYLPFLGTRTSTGDALSLVGLVVADSSNTLRSCAISDLDCRSRQRTSSVGT